MSDPAEIDKGIAAAVAAARRGGVVVLPTEAAYAVATDAFSQPGVAALRELKQRGPQLPVPVAIGSAQTVDGILTGITDSARALMQAYWPGQLTLVGRAQPTLTWSVSAPGDDTVLVRMPLHPVAWRLAQQLGPTALTGANVAGADLPRNCEEVAAAFGVAVAVYLDAGEVTRRTTSTTVDTISDPPELLVQGAITVEQLRSVVPSLVVPGETPPAGGDA